MVEYLIEGRIAVIIGCSEDEEDIDLPEYIEGYPVGKIAPYSFNELNRLKRIVFPKTLRLIGAYAFASCKNLKEVVFSEGLETIEDWAFISCNINSVEFPSTLKSIGENAFMGNPVKLELDASRSSTGEKKINSISDTISIFPIGLLDSIDNITKDIILERAKYYCHQIDFLAMSKIEERQLDLPFIFDGDEFLITLFSKNPLTDFHIEFSSDSMDRMGKYEEDDADFLVLRLEIFSKDVSVGTTAVKVPYLEEGSFEVLDVYSVEDMGYCYYLHVNCNLSCYGTANVEREFAFDMFKELEGKYQTQLDNNLITTEVYRDLKAEIDSNSIDTLKSFLLQVQGVPVLQYLVSIFKAMLADEEIEDKTEIINYTQNRLIEIYNQLGDYDSFVDVCFNMKSAVKFITEFTGLTLEEINQKYNLQIQDDENHSLTTEEIAGYRSALEDNEFNFTLYAEYLNYIYQLMDKMNQEYSMKTYQE